MVYFSLRHFCVSMQLVAASVLTDGASYSRDKQDTPPAPPRNKVKEGLTQIGDHHQIIISSDYEKSDIEPLSSQDGKTDTYVLTHKDASYLSVHFSHFDLPPSCVFEIADDNQDQTFTMTGKGKFDLGTFWAHHVNGDAMELKLSCDKDKDKQYASFEIDDYVAGFPKNNIEMNSQERRYLRSKAHKNEEEYSFLHPIGGKRDLSICGSDDKRNAVCYKNSEPKIYEKAKAVARLYINGSGACTGWLVSGSNLLFTNEHCIDSLSDVQNTDFEFMGEEPTCTNVAGDGSWFSHRNNDGIYDGTALLKKSATWDYALIQLSGNPASKYGFLQLDNRQADINEEIYIPQHPGGRPKELAVFDSNHNGNCKVKGYGGGCAPTDMKYTCDTQGGSSGSPVLSRETNKVVALHHCGGGCWGNLGAPIYKFYDEVSSFLTSSDINNYDFYPYMDSGGYDIQRVVTSGGITDIAAACDAKPNCLGFNSNGWVKYAIRDKSQWSKWTDDPTKGFYVKKGSIDNYDFYPYMDSGGYDIQRVVTSGGITAIAAACDAKPNCRGFNSNGWVKHTLRIKSKWSKWTDDPTKGFYVKKGSINNYSFYPYMDSGGYDIQRVVTSGGITAIAAACDAKPNCLGFNSNGWVKHTLRDKSQWSKWTDDPTKGFYVKN